jgi:hypothetical protein
MAQFYTKIEEVPADTLETLNGLTWPDGRVPTDQEKLETINNLYLLVENVFDMWTGTGSYDRPDYDAAAFRAKQIARHEAIDKMTPQEFYDEAYNEWMQKNGKWHTKQYGMEATEAKCREQATRDMHRALRSRASWHEFKEKFDKKRKNSAGSRKQKKIRQPKFKSEVMADPNRYGSDAYIEREKDPEVLYKDAYNYWMDIYKRYKKDISEKALEFQCRQHAERAVIRAIEEKEARAELATHRKPEKPKKYSY